MFLRLAMTCGALVLALMIGAAQAQSGYPNRVITLVVPYPAGGTADLLCRFAPDKAGSNLGQQVVVENRPGGAGGRVGTESVLRASPDGYTLLCCGAAHVQRHASPLFQSIVRHPRARADQRPRRLSADPDRAREPSLR